MFAIDQQFYMSHRLTPKPRLFELIDQHPETTTFEYVIREVATGEISEVEREWFNTHQITLVDAFTLAGRRAAQ